MLSNASYERTLLQQCSTCSDLCISNTSRQRRSLWPPYGIGQAIIFCPVISIFLSFCHFPRLILESGRRFDVYHTSTHGVALVHIQNACLKCAARGSLKIQDAKKSPFWHHRATLSGYIFGTKACINNRKKLLNRNTSSTCPDNMVNFGLLAADICWRVWGTPANFIGFRVLAALLHGSQVVGVSQTLRR